MCACANWSAAEEKVISVQFCEVQVYGFFSVYTFPVLLTA